MRILLTGGAGYLGSHTAEALLRAGHAVVVLDNLSHSDAAVIAHLQALSGTTVPLIVRDVCDRDALVQTIDDHRIDAVMHFAGLKAVGESVEFPLTYYDQNVRGAISLLEAMRMTGVQTLVFSSSATVYGEPTYLPIDESHRTVPTHPYGQTKRIIEQILTDLSVAEPPWRIAVLRYFNPVGAHESGTLGENPRGIPNNLMPLITRVASGELPELRVFGADYPTADGTGVRDYLHVTDLARGHVAALQRLTETAKPLSLWNLGTGRGHSVLEMIRTFERVNGVSIPFRIVARRSGDVAACYANPAKAERELPWRAQLDLEAMCASAWRFERQRARY